MDIQEDTQSQTLWRPCIAQASDEGCVKVEKRTEVLVLTVIFALLGIVAVFVIIYAGFMLMTSSGDPGKVKKGKDTILYGVIGLVVALLAVVIVNFVVANAL